MKFSEFPYVRPDYAALRERANRGIQAMRRAKTYATFRKAMDAVEHVRSEFETLSVLAKIRHRIDTSDPFYAEENAYFDEVEPCFAAISTRFYQAVLASPFQAELEAEFGKQFLTIAEVRAKRFVKELIPLKVEENKLITRYENLLASCKVLLKGEERNLMGLSALMQSTNREERREAYAAYAGFFAAHEAEFDEIYDNLVHNRTEQGRRMGYDTFIPLGYLNLGRTDYDANDVAAYREQVKDCLVPVCKRIRNAQAKRIGLKKLKFYDEPMLFPDGNAMPKGTEQELVLKALEMYRQLSKETGDFFTEMVEGELMDLATRPNKAAGGFEELIPDHRVPFIFANFNGTSGDVEVFTHEAGHAFQAKRGLEAQILPEYFASTYEVSEIHSMSMEFFTHPYMELFFGDDADQYRFMHSSGSLTFIPYGVLVDEFQHRVYAEPNLTPKERKELWRELERGYLPQRDYDGEAVFEGGAFFYKQLHLFTDPFYYIDYTLASMGAFEFYGKSKKDRAAAWADYLRLCDLGGSLPYLELLKAAQLRNPFEPGSVKAAIAPLVKELDAALRAYRREN